MVLKYLVFILFEARRKGFGIHSPFVFRLVAEVIHSAGSRKCPEHLLRWYRNIRRDKTRMEAGVSGAGSKTGLKGQVSVGGVIGRSSVSLKHACMLYRIVDEFRPAEILELGGGMGVSTLFLAAGNPGAVVHSVESEEFRSAFVRKEAEKLGMENVRFHHDHFQNFLERYTRPESPWLTFIDGDHRKEALLENFRSLKKLADADSIFIFDDIRWSDETYRAWKEIIRDPEVSISVDLFFMGLIFFREGIAKQDFKVHF